MMMIFTQERATHARPEPFSIGEWEKYNKSEWHSTKDASCMEHNRTEGPGATKNTLPSCQRHISFENPEAVLTCFSERQRLTTTGNKTSKTTLWQHHKRRRQMSAVAEFTKPLLTIDSQLDPILLPEYEFCLEMRWRGGLAAESLPTSGMGRRQQTQQCAPKKSTR